MKLSFSTVACPDYSWDEICSIAKDSGFHGIELRGLGHYVDPLTASPFTPAKIGATKAELARRKLEVCCLACGTAITQNGAEEELLRYIDLAYELGTPYIRVLGDRNIKRGEDFADELVIEPMKRLCAYAEEKGVILLLETNGVYADTARLADVLARIGSDSAAALWDWNHTYRDNDESPEITVKNLGAFIKHCHVKDSVMVDGKVEYRLVGDGDLPPMAEYVKALNSVNYEGYLSLEWLKQYVPEIEEAGIVLPHYIHFMSQHLGISGNTKRLHKDSRGNGYYVFEKEHLIDYTFPQVLDRMCEEFPDQYAFRYTEDGYDYCRTYPEFRDDVDTFARALISMGVKQGDHVAIWATNVPQWYITFWATVKIGAVLVTVNTAYKIHEAEYLLRQSDTHTLVMTDGYKDSDYVGIIRELIPELEENEDLKPIHSRKLPFLRNIITVESKQKGCWTWEEAIAQAERTPLDAVHRRAAMINKHDVCNMQYTSGTTGFPKGVMLTHYNIVNNGKGIGDRMDLSTADRMMIQVPMFHCFGMVLAMTASMTHGVTMCPITAFSPRKGLHCINQEKITCFHGVPTMFIAMLGHENFPKTDFSYMRTGIMAGSPCPVKVMEEVVEKMNMSEITIVYGQTEASPGCTQSYTTDSIDVRVSTVGRAFYGVECKIVDPETGEDCPDNVDGEFVARGYNIMKGYYKMPEATAAAIDKDGWLHTGDLARRLPDGNYKITGRIKDMIIRGGENIYPKEIEDFIYTHPKVQDVQVIGVPDKQYGEEIMAVVIVKPGETLTSDEVKQYVMDHMAKHKTPRYVTFVDAFPMNAAGKILKYKMREDAKKLPEFIEAAGIETA